MQQGLLDNQWIRSPVKTTIMQTNCPKCDSDQTQSFTMAHRAGTSSGFAIGAGLTGQGGLGAGGGLGRQQTDIAKLTQPPKKEGGTGESIALIVIAIVIFNVVGVAAGWLFAWFADAQFSVSVWIAGFLVGFVAAMGFGFWAWKHTNSQKNKLDAAYKTAMVRWEHSWICLRCGNTFTIR